MRHLKSAPLLLLFILLAAFSTPGCKKEQRARHMPESVNAYIFGFTSGIISKNTPIRVRFASLVAKADQIGQAADKQLLSFSPSLAGKAIWEDEQTLRFIADAALPSGTSYIATVKLSRIFPDVPSEAAAFEFDFRTREQSLAVDITGLHAPDVRDLKKQEIRGVVSTGDVADSESIEKSLTARQDGKDLTVEWDHGGDANEHRFFVRKVARSDRASSVDISWNGKAIGVAAKDSKKMEVPALGDFKILDARVVSGESRYIQLHFSDPLNENQNPAGLVSVSNFSGNLRYVIDGNQLRLYPDTRMEGTHRVFVDAGLKNVNNRRMKAAAQWDVVFDDTAPEVRLVGKGVVVPNSDGLLFPFEVRGLEAIEVEIFKIYHNNVLQFLQSQNLDDLETYSLQQVGRVVLQKKIPLSKLSASAKQGEWVRYALDLGDFVAKDKEAIYQVRIGFRKDYASRFCGKKPVASEDDLGMEKPNIGEDGEIVSIMDGWYGLDGWYDNYNWADREDPCKGAYYNSERFAQRNVIASNLGIIVKGSGGLDYQVVVSDLRTARTIGNVKVEFYDFQQQLLNMVQTDADGIANIRLERRPFVVVARHGEDKGYLKINEGQSLSLSRFDVAGEVNQKGIKGFLYGDRGVWRPGDSVFLNFILEDRGLKLPPNYPIAFELYDPNGQVQQKRASVKNTGGIYPLYFATDADAPTGNWVASVKVGGASFTRVIKVETVKPNRIKIDLNTGGDLVQGNKAGMTLAIQATWLHGAAGSGLKAITEARVQVDKSGFTALSDFVFHDPARAIDSEAKVVFDGFLNDRGAASFTAQPIDPSMAPGMLKASFKTRVFEQGGDFSSDNVTVAYSPFSNYVGVAIPKSRYGEKRLELKQNGKVGLVSVDGKGKAAANRQLKAGLYRVESHWWWDNNESDVSRFNSANHFNAISTADLQTNGRGETTWSLKVEEWGRYLVRVCDTQSGHCTGDFFYAGYPDGGDDTGPSAATMLNFSADKPTYNVGETVKLSIPTGEVGRALVSIESGNKVVQTFWVDAKSGANNISFEATPDMAPNVYAHVTLIQPHAQVKNDRPIRMYGIVPIMVEDPKTRLAPKVKMPEELKPEQTVAIEVSEENGQEMAYTIDIVDEGLLGLTRHKTPNPWGSFYAREALGVQTWDIYDYVVGAHGGQMERLLGIGGDGDVELSPGAQQANRFKPVVIHLGPFLLKKGQKTTHKVKLPNYVGAVRTMVVAAKNGAYGHAEATALVRNPLMVLATLPRVLSPGEELTLPVNVFATGNKVKSVNVKVTEKSGLATLGEGGARSISFAKPGDKLVDFTCKVGERVGIAKFLITAEGNGEKSSQEIEIEVRNPNPYVTNVDNQIVEAGKSVTLNYAPVGTPGTNTIELEASVMPPIDLGRHLQYLLQYPYGCLEQTISGGFPQLYVSKLIELDEAEKKRIPERIRASIERLRSFQTSTGGFAYWPGQPTPDAWSSTYAGHFLLEAKALGYSVPADMLENWTNYQKKTARIWSPDLLTYGFIDFGSYQLDQSYRLYTLALAGQPDMAAMNRLRERDGTSLQTQWRLAAAYAAAGKKEVAQGIVKDLSTNIAPYTELSYTFGSDLRDRAMVLETLLLLGQKTKAAEMVKYISEELSNQRWYSTQTVAYGLLAIGKYVGGGDVSKKVKFTYQVNADKVVNAGANSPILSIALPASKSGKVMVKNSNNAPLYVRVLATGQPAVGKETADANDLAITVRYTDMRGKALDPAKILQGTDFLAEVTVRHPGIRAIPYKEMALAHIFPAGWEISNDRMNEVSSTGTESPFSYRDYRDDRVNTFFDLSSGTSKTFRVQLTAAYKGRYYLPATACAAMYDSSIQARSTGRWVEVVNDRSS